VPPASSPEDGNRSSFRNVVFFRIPDDGRSKKKTVIPKQFSLRTWSVGPRSDALGDASSVTTLIERWLDFCRPFGETLVGYDPDLFASIVTTASAAYLTARTLGAWMSVRFSLSLCYGVLCQCRAYDGPIHPPRS
jgi:hypothetical protein